MSEIQSHLQSQKMTPQECLNINDVAAEGRRMSLCLSRNVAGFSATTPCHACLKFHSQKCELLPFNAVLPHFGILCAIINQSLDINVCALLSCSLRFYGELCGSSSRSMNGMTKGSTTLNGGSLSTAQSHFTVECGATIRKDVCGIIIDLRPTSLRATKRRTRSMW